MLKDGGKKKIKTVFACNVEKQGGADSGAVDGEGQRKFFVCLLVHVFFFVSFYIKLMLKDEGKKKMNIVSLYTDSRTDTRAVSDEGWRKEKDEHCFFLRARKMWIQEQWMVTDGGYLFDVCL